MYMYLLVFLFVCVILILMNRSSTLVPNKNVEKLLLPKPVEKFVVENQIQCLMCGTDEVVNDNNQCVCNSNTHYRELNIATNNPCVSQLQPCGTTFTSHYTVNSFQPKQEEIQITCTNCPTNERVRNLSDSNCYCPSPLFRNTVFPRQCDSDENLCRSNQSYTAQYDSLKGESNITCANCPGLNQIRSDTNPSECVCIPGMKKVTEITSTGFTTDIGCRDENSPCRTGNYYWVDNGQTITCYQCSNSLEIGMPNGCICNSNYYIRRDNDDSCVLFSSMCSGIPGAESIYDSHFSYESNVAGTNNYSITEKEVSCTYCGSNEQRKPYPDTDECECVTNYYRHNNDCKLPRDACESNQRYEIDQVNRTITCFNCDLNEVRDDSSPNTCKCAPAHTKVFSENTGNNQVDSEGCQPDNNYCGYNGNNSNNFYWENHFESGINQGIICKQCKDDDAVGQFGGCTCPTGYTRRSNDDECIFTNTPVPNICGGINEPGVEQRDDRYKYVTNTLNNDYGTPETQYVCTLCGPNQVRGPNGNSCVCEPGYIWHIDSGQCVNLDTQNPCNTDQNNSNYNNFGTSIYDVSGIYLGPGNQMSNLSCGSCTGDLVTNNDNTGCVTCSTGQNEFANSTNSACVQCSNNEQLDANDKCTCKTDYIYTEYYNSELSAQSQSECEYYNGYPTNLCRYDDVSSPYNSYKYTFGTEPETSTTAYDRKVSCTKCTVPNSVRGSGANSNNCVCAPGYYYFNSNGIPTCISRTDNPCENYVRTTTTKDGTRYKISRSSSTNYEKQYGDQSTDVDGQNLAQGVMSNITCEPCDSTTQVYNDISKQCECAPGFGLSNGECVTCPDGHFKDSAGDRSCSPCVDNWPYNGSYVTSDSTQCINCIDGSSNTGSSCVCDVGHEIIPGITSISYDGSHCQDCPSGTYKSEAGDYSCSTCSIPGQYYNSGTQRCEYCGVNQEPNTDDSGCTDCPGGHYSGSNVEKCSSSPCDPNYVPHPVTGEGCSNCDIGYRSPENSSDCILCTNNRTIPSDDGYRCDSCGANKKRRSDANLCECSDGYIYDTTSRICNSETSRCGYRDSEYSYDEYNSLEPGVPQFSDNTGLFDRYVQCTRCPTNEVRHNTDSSRCVCDSINAYHRSTTIDPNIPSYNQNNCININDCKDTHSYNVYIDLNDGESKIECLQCPGGGSRGTGDNTDRCICPSGYVRNNQCSEANPCSFGEVPSYTERTTDLRGDSLNNYTMSNVTCGGCGLNEVISGSSCVCSPGYYRNGTNCSPCPTGQYKDVPGNATQCTPCSTGSTTVGIASTACVCSPGYGLTGFVQKNGSHCSICQSGTVKEGTSNNTCELCNANSPDFEYQPNQGQTACLTCVSGHNIQNNQCNACGTGKYRNSSSNCVDIPNTNQIGNNDPSTLINGVFTDLLTCEGGSVRGGNGNQCVCPSSSNYYNTGTGMCSVADPCTGNTVPTYSVRSANGKTNSPLATSNVNCSGCPNYSTIVSGNCLCNPGYKFDTACTICPDGEFKTGTNNDTDCTQCGYGPTPYNNPFINVSIPDRDECSNCPLGSFANNDNSGCEPCNSNTRYVYTSTNGSRECRLLGLYEIGTVPNNGVWTNKSICQNGRVRGGTGNQCVCQNGTIWRTDHPSVAQCVNSSNVCSWETTNDIEIHTTGNVGGVSMPTVSCSNCPPGQQPTSSTTCGNTGPVWNEDNMFANVLSDYDNNFTIHQQINSHFNTVLTS